MSSSFSTLSLNHGSEGNENDGVGKTSGEVQTWNTNSLSTMRPYLVKYTGPDQGILGIASYGELVDPAFLATVIDGMVMAVCVIEDDACFLSHPAFQNPPPETDEYGNEVEETPQDADGNGDNMDNGFNRLVARSPEGLPYILPTHSGLVTPLDPTYSRCLGLALVRAIDAQRGELQLLTPIPETEIQEALGDDGTGRGGRGRIVLVRGKFDCPDWAFLEQVFASGAVEDGLAERGPVGRPYVAERKVGGEAGLGGNVWRVRHLPRKMGGEGGGGRA